MATKDGSIGSKSTEAMDFAHYSKVAEQSGVGSPTLMALSTQFIDDPRHSSLGVKSCRSRLEAGLRCSRFRPFTDDQFANMLRSAAEAHHEYGRVDWLCLMQAMAVSDQTRGSRNTSLKAIQQAVLEFFLHLQKRSSSRNRALASRLSRHNNMGYAQEDEDSLDEGEAIEDSVHRSEPDSKAKSATGRIDSNDNPPNLLRSERKGRGMRGDARSRLASSNKNSHQDHPPTILRSSQRIKQMQMKQSSLSPSGQAPPLTYMRLTEEFLRNASPNLLNSVMSANIFEVHLSDGRVVDLSSTLDPAPCQSSEVDLVSAFEDPVGVFLSFMEGYAKSQALQSI